MVPASASGYAVYLDGQVSAGDTVTSPFDLTSAPVYLLGRAGGFGFTNYRIGRVAVFAGVLTAKDWRLLMAAFTGVY